MSETKNEEGLETVAPVATVQTGHDIPTEKGRFDGEDVGAAVLAESGENFEYTEAEARAVLWKIDLHLLPAMCFTYLIQFLDKSCVSYAAIWGMRKEAHLVGADYSWLTTLFYIGYLFSEFPTNLLFQKFNITKACGVYMTLWGTILLCMTAANNFAGLATARFFLGVMECGVSPCFVLLTAMYWKKTEQPLRTGIWFAMNGFANVIGGLIGYSIGYINASIPVWKFPFVIFGSATIAWGIAFFFLTPANPTEAKWLTQREKAIAVLRLAENETGIDNKKFKMYQLREAFTDLRTWVMILIMLANCIPNGGVSAFGPLIVNGFGYSTFDSTLLNMPSGAAQIMALVISGYLASRFKGIRHFLALGGLLVAIIGASMIYGLPTERKVPRLIGYYLLVGFSVTFVQLLGLIQANVAGRTKKNIVTSSIFVAYCVGNLIGPQLFFSNQAPRYQSGFAAMLVCFCAQIVLYSALYFLNAKENRTRDAIQASTAQDTNSNTVIVLGLSDLTDKENLHFRYVL